MPNLLSTGGSDGKGTGRAVTIVVGGATESLEAFPNQIRIILKDRKIFVKLAMRTGADLVPVLLFGENELYQQVETDDQPVIQQLQSLTKRILGWTLPMFYGTGFFGGHGMMPFRCPLNIVVGKPVAVVQQSDSDFQDVDRLHALYIAGLCTLWDEWKERFAPGKVGGMELL